MREQLVDALLADGIFDAIRRADTGDHAFELRRIRSGARNVCLHCLPWAARALICESQHIVAENRKAAVRDADEVATVGGGCHVRRSLDNDLQDFATIFSTNDRWQYLDIHRQFADALPRALQQFDGNTLSWWRQHLRVLDSDQQASAGTIGETDAGARDVVPVGPALGDQAQRLVLGLQAFGDHGVMEPFIRRGRSRSRATRSLTFCCSRISHCACIGCTYDRKAC